MLLTQFVLKAEELVIDKADNGLSYLEPMWQQILNDNEMKVSDISDATVELKDLFDIFKLEVEKRNTINSKKPYVLDWLYDVITAEVDPAMLAEETEYLKNFIDYKKVTQEK